MKSAACRFYLRHDARHVVGSDLLIAGAARPGAHGAGCGFERDGFETCGVVRANGAANYVEERGAWRANAQSALSADEGWADVEGEPAGAWHVRVIGESFEKLVSGVRALTVE